MCSDLSSTVCFRFIVCLLIIKFNIRSCKSCVFVFCVCACVCVWVGGGGGGGCLVRHVGGCLFVGTHTCFTRQLMFKLQNQRSREENLHLCSFNRWQSSEWDISITALLPLNTPHPTTTTLPATAFSPRAARINPAHWQCRCSKSVSPSQQLLISRCESMFLLMRPTAHWGIAGLKISAMTAWHNVHQKMKRQWGC